MAGWIYAIAGWIGSAMGIGMGQNLGHVPPLFVAAAGAAVLLATTVFGVCANARESWGLSSVVILAAFSLYQFFFAGDATPQLAQVERGRQVYISEGCIHCHSQYVRPNSPDVLMWGPIKSIAELRAENPPLIGNRRQGPDLAEVGSRRSALWLKAHFYNPAEVSGSSIMPSFGFLFRDGRGDDLVAYLESLHAGDTERHLAKEKAMAALCRRCRPGKCGRGRTTLSARLRQLPQRGRARATRVAIEFQAASFRSRTKGPYFYLSPSNPRQRLIRLEQIAKFGIPGTDMPGHEYLSDRDIASISLWLSQVIAQSNQQP